MALLRRFFLGLVAGSEDVCLLELSVKVGAGASSNPPDKTSSDAPWAPTPPLPPRRGLESTASLMVAAVAPAVAAPALAHRCPPLRPVLLSSLLYLSLMMSLVCRKNAIFPCCLACLRGGICAFLTTCEAGHRSSLTKIFVPLSFLAFLITNFVTVARESCHNSARFGIPTQPNPMSSF